jgi:hypothetical protein
MKEQWGAYPDLYFYIGGLLYGLPSQKKKLFCDVLLFTITFEGGGWVWNYIKKGFI